MACPISLLGSCKMLTAENSSFKCTLASVFLYLITSKPPTSRQTEWPWQRADYWLLCASYHVLLPLFSILAEAFLTVCQEHFLPQEAIIYTSKEMNNLKYLRESESFFLAVLWGLSTPLLVMPGQAPNKSIKGKTAFAKGLKDFRVSSTCRFPKQPSLETLETRRGRIRANKDFWQKNGLLIFITLDHLCTVCNAALW